MNVFLNEYSGFCFALNFELNHFYARFNEKMDFQNGSARARWHCALEGGQFRFWSNLNFMLTCGISQSFRIFNPTFEQICCSKFSKDGPQKQKI